MIEVDTTGFTGLKVISPKIYKDPRGYFFESYNQETFNKKEIMQNFVQDNQSFSQKNTLRGLHFQTGNHAQCKLIRVLDGAILDVVVDLRKDEPTFTKHYAIKLTSDNYKQLLVPKGFAHGFLVLSDTALISYKCDSYYAPTHEVGLHFSDPDLQIDWGIPQENAILSEKDKKNLSLKEILNNESYISHRS